MPLPPVHNQNPALPLGTLPISALEAFQGAVLGAILGEQGLCAPGPTSPQHNQSHSRSQLDRMSGERAAGVWSDASPPAPRPLDPTASPYVQLLCSALQTYGRPDGDPLRSLVSFAEPIGLPGLDRPVLTQALALAIAAISPGSRPSLRTAPPSAPQPVPLQASLSEPATPDATRPPATSLNPAPIHPAAPNPAHLTPAAPNPALHLALHCLHTSPHSWLLTVRRCWFLSDPVQNPAIDRALDRRLTVTLAASLSGFALGHRAIPLVLQRQLGPEQQRSAIALAQACFCNWAGMGTTGDRPLPTLSLHPRPLGQE